MICALVIIDNSVITAAGRHIYASLVESGSPITIRKVIRLAKSVDNYCIFGTLFVFHCVFILLSVSPCVYVC